MWCVHCMVCFSTWISVASLVSGNQTLEAAVRYWQPSTLPITFKLSTWWAFHLQLSAVITCSNIVRYFMNNYRNWGRISIRCWIHKRHPIPHSPWRASYGVSFVNICEKIDHVMMAPWCILCSPIMRWCDMKEYCIQQSNDKGRAQIKS